MSKDVSCSNILLDIEASAQIHTGAARTVPFAKHLRACCKTTASGDTPHADIHSTRTTHERVHTTEHTRHHACFYQRLRQRLVASGTEEDPASSPVSPSQHRPPSHHTATATDAHSRFFATTITGHQAAPHVFRSAYSKSSAFAPYPSMLRGTPTRSKMTRISPGPEAATRLLPKTTAS